MNPFILHLQAATKYQKVENVTSFVGQDSAGKFGIMANHGRFITVLVFGLVKYKTENELWSYIALPGGVLHFVNNDLFISTRQFYIDDSYERISEVLEKSILKEEKKLKNMRHSLQSMEQEMFKRLWHVGRLERE